MAFNAQVVRVLIASPSDVAEERDRIERAIHRWNADHAESAGVMLLPVRWEENATAEMGMRAQAVINKQLVDSCDLLIGTFWTRMGTPTGVAESGTAEEIQRAIDAGKHVSLYFSNVPVLPANIDTAQMSALEAFRRKQEAAGLVLRYDSPDALERQVSSMLVRVVRERFGTAPAEPRAGNASAAAEAGATVRALFAAEARIRLRVHREPRRGGAGSNYWIVVENVGNGMAENVTVSWAGPNDQSAWPLLDADAPIEYLPPGADFKYLAALSLASASRGTFEVTWRNEDGSEGSTRQSLSLT